MTPKDEGPRYLVPDLAYISYERLPREAVAAASEPHVAPNAVFEIKSPSERNIHALHKVSVYLRSGSDRVCVLDPYERRLIAHDREEVRYFSADAVFSHAALPDFELDLLELFAALDA